MSDINVRLLDFGNSVPAAATLNDDGTLSIFLNARVSYEKRLEAYLHELRHYKRDDFHSSLTVDHMESINAH